MRIDALLFDMDGTTIQYPVPFGSSWGMLCSIYGLLEEHNRLLTYYLKRPDQYEIWFRNLTELFKGKSLSYAKEHMLPPVYADGIRETCQALKKLGKRIGIISGGLDFIVLLRKASSMCGNLITAMSQEHS